MTIWSEINSLLLDTNCPLNVTEIPKTLESRLESICKVIELDRLSSMTIWSDINSMLLGINCSILGSLNTRMKDKTGTRDVRFHGDK